MKYTENKDSRTDIDHRLDSYPTQHYRIDVALMSFGGYSWSGYMLIVNDVHWKMICCTTMKYILLQKGGVVYNSLVYPMAYRNKD